MPVPRDRALPRQRQHGRGGQFRVPVMFNARCSMFNEETPWRGGPSGPPGQKMEIMKRAQFLLIAAIWPTLALAQAPDLAKVQANPVSGTVREIMAPHAKNIMAAAELMPADKYTFHPTPAQMTYGQLIAHILQTNEFLCSAIEGAPKPPPTSPTDKDPKDVLVKALKESFDHCAAALAAVKEDEVGALIPMGPQKVPRAYFMIGLVVDWADHYSTQASYLR